jgi:hypothetical protein
MRLEESSRTSGISRREFLGGSWAAVLAATVADSTAAESSTVPKLVLHGDEKAVKQSGRLPIRWGEPERERLNAGLFESFATNYRMSELQCRAPLCDVRGHFWPSQLARLSQLDLEIVYFRAFTLRVS